MIIDDIKEKEKKKKVPNVSKSLLPKLAFMLINAMRRKTGTNTFPVLEKNGS